MGVGAGGFVYDDGDDFGAPELVSGDGDERGGFHARGELHGVEVERDLHDIGVAGGPLRIPGAAGVQVGIGVGAVGFGSDAGDDFGAPESSVGRG